MIVPSVNSMMAFAQYYIAEGDVQTGLDHRVQDAKDKVAIAKDGLGSGTPLLAADGVWGITSLNGHFWWRGNNIFCKRSSW